ncbi:MAG: PEP-CTERM sorting domain-containing protein [gamma proteobacterium endosymbiont of Lamellibrachia anaximandri]|nr:PEP-CTERM sorting domain-containing protein [gamma proteobacterium endosymbiont of Lamellibrachia anaximandri]MBL3617845.1 PEP-CTERM sorting domain-containing protein [gamma proteobacterium endosymbiont of Lamellibrachia anaximandri]
MLAKFTGYASEGFGVFENIASAPYREALVATSNPFYTDPLDDLFTDLGVSPFDVFSYGMESNLCGSTVNSIENRNACVRDHMVTWEILNGQSAGNFILAWEDLTDNDFNDLVLEVRGTKPVGTPEPAAWLLFSTGYLILRRRRRKLEK